MKIYDFTITNSDGEEVSLSSFKGKVLLIANTASKCGFTPQYEALQTLYNQYNQQGLEILAFPCNQFGNQEPGNNQEITSFCSLNYGLTFPVMSKVDVNGSNAHPIFSYLQENAPGILGKSIKWNFTKFLVDKEGNVVDRFAPTTSPLKLQGCIEELLAL